MYAQDNNSLLVWIILSPAHHHISINSQPFLVGIVSIHHEDDSSDDKSVIEIEPRKENGEQENGKQDKLLTTKFQIEIENRKVEGLITYTTDQ